MYLRSVCSLEQKQFPSPKIRSNICVMFSGWHQLCKSVVVFPLSVFLVYVFDEKTYSIFFLNIWPLLIIPPSTNKSQPHILSCLLCAAASYVKEMLSTI